MLYFRVEPESGIGIFPTECHLWTWLTYIGREALTENHGSPNVPFVESTMARYMNEKPPGPTSKLMEIWDKQKWLTVRV